MNTQSRLQRLEPGQALQQLHRGETAVLSQGEVLVQEPARWLGGTVVWPAPVRYAAPAVLPDLREACVTALHEATVVLQSPAPAAVGDWLGALARWRRRLAV